LIYHPAHLHAGLSFKRRMYKEAASSLPNLIELLMLKCRRADRPSTMSRAKGGVSNGIPHGNTRMCLMLKVCVSNVLLTRPTCTNKVPSAPPNCKWHLLHVQHIRQFVIVQEAVTWPLQSQATRQLAAAAAATLQPIPDHPRPRNSSKRQLQPGASSRQFQNQTARHSAGDGSVQHALYTYATCGELTGSSSASTRLCRRTMAGSRACTAAARCMPFGPLTSRRRSSLLSPLPVAY
jgi:hypothetical protein